MQQSKKKTNHKKSIKKNMTYEGTYPRDNFPRQRRQTKLAFRGYPLGSHPKNSPEAVGGSVHLVQKNGRVPAKKGIAVKKHYN